MAEGLADVEVADVDFFLDVVLFLDVVFFEVEVAVTTGAVAGAEEEVEAVAWLGLAFRPDRRGASMSSGSTDQ